MVWWEAGKCGKGVENQGRRTGELDYKTGAKGVELWKEIYQWKEGDYYFG